MANKNFVFTTVGALAIILALAALFFWGSQTNTPREVNNNVNSVNVEALAQCLKDKDVVMYGAEWCSHCQNQKKLFGESFKLVPYVECPQETDKCLAAGIQGYPTWIFPASPAGGPGGQQLLGEQTLEKLAETSGCAF